MHTLLSALIAVALVFAGAMDGLSVEVEPKLQGTLQITSTLEPAPLGQPDPLRVTLSTSASALFELAGLQLFTRLELGIAGLENASSRVTVDLRIANLETEMVLAAAFDSDGRWLAPAQVVSWRWQAETCTVAHCSQLSLLVDDLNSSHPHPKSGPRPPLWGFGLIYELFSDSPDVRFTLGLCADPDSTRALKGRSLTAAATCSGLALTVALLELTLVSEPIRAQSALRVEPERTTETLRLRARQGPLTLSALAEAQLLPQFEIDHVDLTVDWRGVNLQLRFDENVKPLYQDARLTFAFEAYTLTLDVRHETAKGFTKLDLALGGDFAEFTWELSARFCNTDAGSSLCPDGSAPPRLHLLRVQATVRRRTTPVTWSVHAEMRETGLTLVEIEISLRL